MCELWSAFSNVCLVIMEKSSKERTSLGDKKVHTKARAGGDDPIVDRKPLDGRPNGQNLGNTFIAAHCRQLGANRIHTLHHVQICWVDGSHQESQQHIIVAKLLGQLLGLNSKRKIEKKNWKKLSGPSPFIKM